MCFVLSGICKTPVSEAASASLSPQHVCGGDRRRPQLRDQENRQTQRPRGAAVERGPNAVRNTDSIHNTEFY